MVDSLPPVTLAYQVQAEAQAEAEPGQAVEERLSRLEQGRVKPHRGLHLYPVLLSDGSLPFPASPIRPLRRDS